MKIPFTVEEFFGVFARYNEAVWPMQVILTLLALTAVAMLYGGRSFQSRLISALLACLWGWMAIAYHFTFFTLINPAAWLFGAMFLAAGLWFAWMGIMRVKLRFRLTGGIRGWAGWLLIGFALVAYPLLGNLLGHRYPAVPTFGLPCPTTIFTIGILLFVASPVPKSVFIVPLIWSLIGSMAAFQLGVCQDLGLLVAGVVGLVAAIAGPAQPTAASSAVV